MGHKKTITLAKELDFSTENEYFQYILESYINGQFAQIRRLYGELNNLGKSDFKIYLDNEGSELFGLKAIEAVRKRLDL